MTAATFQASMRTNVFALIGAAAAVLSLITANECSSIFHLPSLLYGCVLWGWWAVVASALWGAHQRARVSFQFILLHTAAAALLGWAHLFTLWTLGFIGMDWYGNLPKWSAFHTLLNLNRFGNEVLFYGFVFSLIGFIQCSSRVRSLELEKQLSSGQLRSVHMEFDPNAQFNAIDAVNDGREA
jgi:hypothetical protein